MIIHYFKLKFAYRSKLSLKEKREKICTISYQLIVTIVFDIFQERNRKEAIRFKLEQEEKLAFEAERVKCEQLKLMKQR